MRNPILRDALIKAIKSGKLSVKLPKPKLNKSVHRPSQPTRKSNTFKFLAIKKKPQ